MNTPNTQPTQQWVGLTDDEIDSCFSNDLWKKKNPHRVFGRAVEAKLRAKNATVKESLTVEAQQGWKLVPIEFLRGFNILAHNYSLQAVPPDFYTGTEGDAFRMAYRRCGQDLGKLRAMLAAAPQAPANQWMPIESAPKDGTAVLGKLPDSDLPHSVRFVGGWWQIAWDGHNLSLIDFPTYWMPIPPIQQQGGSNGAKA